MVDPSDPRCELSLYLPADRRLVLAFRPTRLGALPPIQISR